MMIVSWAVPFAGGELSHGQYAIIAENGIHKPSYAEALEVWRTGNPRWAKFWFDRDPTTKLGVEIRDASESLPRSGAGLHEADGTISWPGFVFDPTIIGVELKLDGEVKFPDLDWTWEPSSNPYSRMAHTSVEIDEKIRIQFWIEARHKSKTVAVWTHLTWLDRCSVADFGIIVEPGWAIAGDGEEAEPGVQFICGPIDFQSATLDSEIDDEWLSRMDIEHGDGTRAAWAARDIDPTGAGLSFRAWIAPEDVEIEPHINLPIDPERLTQALPWIPSLTGRVSEEVAQLQAEWIDEYLVPLNHPESGTIDHPLLRDLPTAQTYARAGDGTIRRKWRRFLVNPYGVGYWAMLRHIATGCPQALGIAERTVRQICDLQIPLVDRHNADAGSLVNRGESIDVWSGGGYVFIGMQEPSSLLHLWIIATGDPIASQTLRARARYLIDRFSAVEPDETGDWGEAIQHSCRGYGWRLVLIECCVFAPVDPIFRAFAARIVDTVCDPESEHGLDEHWYEHHAYGKDPLYKADWAVTALWDAWDRLGLDTARRSAIRLCERLAEVGGVPGTGDKPITYQSQRLHWVSRWWRETSDPRALAEHRRLMGLLQELAELWCAESSEKKGVEHFEHGPSGMAMRHYVRFDPNLALFTTGYVSASAMIGPYSGELS